eukprot:TRINITY_DN3457_c3_g1_i1.p1 TRINITY_DN3457_c3_g1~~TRINITY_DN3457_c3_g1_i1.p1  ORF type:complete len:571 (+),score=222.31 TRINITY_DN3457_c3_g1_i1:174-1715(+)
MDVACGLANRRFEYDLGKVIARAKQTGVDGIVIYSNDFDKQKALEQLAKDYSGFIYFSIGIHPDNIKRGNDKIIAQKLEAFKEMALTMPECVAIVAGLDLSREVGTHYAQEKLFNDQLAMASSLEIPVVIHQVAAVEQVVEKLTNLETPISRCAIHNFSGSIKEMESLLGLPFPVYFIITGLICDPNSEQGSGMRQILPFLPLNRLMVATDAPLHTPQNISDTYVRSQHNEPSNIPHIFDEISSLLNSQVEIQVEKVGNVRETILNNSKFFFGIRYHDEAPLEGEVEIQVENQVENPESSSLVTAMQNLQDLEVKDEESDEESDEAPSRSDQSTSDAIPSDATSDATQVEKEMILFSCKSCRKRLFTESDLSAHGTRNFGEISSENSSIELDACQVIFLQPDRLSNLNMIAGDTTESGRLTCKTCGNKLGRYSTEGPIVCTCGLPSQVPAFAIKKKGVDIILPLSHIQPGRDLEVDDEDDDGPVKKKKGSKKKKSQQRKNKSNLSSFRNKNFS